MIESEPPKRRGRPRVPEEERKRHTLTFRMRGDLREAVEELAEANGRTLSEQVEYYVDAAVFSEAGLIYQYSTDAMSPTLQRCISNRLANQDCKEKVTLSVSFPSDHREMLTFAGKTCLNHRHTAGFLPWAQEPGGREGAVAMVRAMLSATRAGAIDALVAAVGSEAVEAALADEAQARPPAPSQPQRVTMKPDMLAHLPGGAPTLAEAQASFEQLHAAPGQAAPAGSVPQDLSLASLKAHLGRLTGPAPDLRPLLSSWPRKFSQLPGDTRAALIRALKDAAEATYEAMMRPEYPPRMAGQPKRPAVRGMAHTAQMTALVRMQRALLPRRDGDDFDPDEEAFDEGDDTPARDRA